MVRRADNPPEEGGFALAIQQLRGGTSQVLILGQLAGYRNGDRWFDVDDVEQLFEDLRVPPPRDVRRAVRQLVSTEMLRAPRTGEDRWTLTPQGDRRVSSLIGALDLNELAPLLAMIPGAEFGNAIHTVIPPSLAPAKWAEGINAILDRFPFETSVLCMTRFPDQPEVDLPDPVGAVIRIARAILASHGLHLHLALDRTIDDDLWGNVAAHAWASKYGLGLFEDRSGEGVNANMIIEVGAMVMTGRRCALLRDRTVERMPTDLVGRIYKPVDYDDDEGVARAIHQWCSEDLSLGPCGSACL